MSEVESDSYLSLVYEDELYDNESMELYESQTTAVHCTDEIPCHKFESLQSYESEFDIEDLQFDEEDESEDEPLREQSTHTLDKPSLDGSNLPNLRYESLTTDDIFQRMLQRVDHLQPVLSIPAEDILLLMQRFDWSEERLLEDWTEKADELLIGSGLKRVHEADKEGENGLVRGIKHRESFTCPICCEDKTETFVMECGHEYCTDCYKHYIKDLLNQGNIITCMGCSLALKNEDIDLIMGSASIIN